MKSFKSHFLNEADDPYAGDPVYASSWTRSFLTSLLKAIESGNVDVVNPSAGLGFWDKQSLMDRTKEAINILTKALPKGVTPTSESRTIKDKPKFTETTIRKTWVGKRPVVHGDKKYNRNKNKQIPND